MISEYNEVSEINTYMYQRIFFCLCTMPVYTYFFAAIRIHYIYIFIYKYIKYIYTLCIRIYIQNRLLDN